MQILNFIPEDYVRRKLIRKANLLCALLVAAVAAALGVVFILLSAAEERLAAHRAEVDQATSRAWGGVQQWQKFQGDRQAVLERANRASRLLNPLPRSRITAEIVQLLPSRVSLTEFHFLEDVGQLLDPPLAKGPAAQRTPAKTGSERKVQRDIRLRLMGLAPTDVDVAQLIAALSSSSLFEQVELSYSEDQAFQGGSLRRFEVLFRLSDDAQRKAIKPASEQVAKASKGGRG